MVDEQGRLEAVSRFKQLDDTITKELTDIAKLIAQICDTPIALVTLLDNDIQWFKASVGTELTCTKREIAFCNNTIVQDGLTIIEDASADEAHKNNPLVANDPNVKFYAGSKLVTKDNFAIGSLCVIDYKPKMLSQQQQSALTVLSKQVMNLMELNWSNRLLASQHKKTQEHKNSVEKSELKLKAIFNSSKDTHMLVGHDFKILAFNKSASVFVSTIYKKKLSNGDSILNYTDPRLLKQFMKLFALALTGRSSKKEWMLMAGTANECWKETSFVPVKNNEEEVIGIAINSTDITTRKRHEKMISIQNEALTRIAIIQSHELRRPVASLLGIMDLMKMDNADFDYLDILEHTINELDQKIRSIVKDSEDTIQEQVVKHLSVVA